MALELKYNLNGHVDNPRVVGGSWRFRKSEIDFAADLAQVIVGKGNEEYLDPGLFFANTYPTKHWQTAIRTS